LSKLFVLQADGPLRRLQVYIEVGSAMSEAEKKGSKWPWILVPVGAVSLFFVLRYCQRHLPPVPPSEPAAAEAATPAPPASP
jgi:hypothetical protein